MFSLNFHPEAPIIANKLDERLLLCLKQHYINWHVLCVPVSLYYLYLYLHYHNRTPLITAFNTPSAMACSGKRAAICQINKQNNTQARAKMTLVSTHATC